MDNEMFADLAVLLCSAAGFLFGAQRYLKPKKPLYAAMIVLGVGCVMLGRLYQCVCLLTGTALSGSFHMGLLGTVGAFSFFFSSNFGQIDSLVDDGSRQLASYRAAAWAGPGCVAILYGVLAAGPIPVVGKIVYAAIAAVIAAACYFHVKHLLIPDVDYGVVRCLRPYNALAFCFGILSMVELIARSRSLTGLFIINTVLLCAVSAALVPMMDRGVQAWRT